MFDVNKKFLVVGCGRSGLAALALLNYLGAKSIKTFADASINGLAADYSDVEGLFLTYDPHVVVLSPGYPRDSVLIKECLKRNLDVLGEINFAFSFLKSEKVIGVTGSVGKSSTCAFIDYGLKASGKSVSLVGNFGRPLSDYVLDKMKSGKISEFLVLELSSYQLEDPRGIELELGIINSFLPNHMDRYQSVNDYYRVKAGIAEISQQNILLNARSPTLVKYFKERCLSNVKEVNGDDDASLLAPGSFQKENYSLARAVGKCLDLGEAYQKALKHFPGLEHRLERLSDERRGIVFYNDSKATTIGGVNSALVEVCNMHKGRNIYLLVGGKDKGHLWETLDVPDGVKIVSFGSCAKLISEIHRCAESYESLSNLCKSFFLKLEPHDVVLLSPGGSSFDEFSNFEERGSFFKTHVKKFFSNADSL